jgi:hypothetical protein
MPHDFTRDRPAGFMEPLPENARLELERRFPELPIDALEKEFGFYLLEREAAIKSGQQARA